MRKLQICTLAFTLLLMIGCDTNQNKSEVKEFLPSWNDGQTKSSIISFVEDVTDENNAGYVAPADRIATFDNDGNLWAEQPFYFQLRFAKDRIKAMAADHPEWADDPVYKAAIDEDLGALLHFGKQGLAKVMMTTHAGMNTDEFEEVVTEWINTAKHPKTGKLYKEMVYQPMLELLDYLRANDFKVFIVSGGGIEFMRAWAEDVYKIPRDQIIGSTIKTEFKITDGVPEIIRLPELDFNDDKEGKPLSINKFIGRKPIFASGNSDGDLQMMQWTASGEGKRFMLYLHHTDAEREWAYDRDSHIGRLDKGLDEAIDKGWTVTDMKNDWKVIFPFELVKD